MIPILLGFTEWFFERAFSGSRDRFACDITVCEIPGNLQQQKGGIGLIIPFSQIVPKLQKTI